MPNWGKLKAQGRVKDVGLPWSAEEQAAISAGVPADYVRRGALSLADYEKMLASDEESRDANGNLPLEAAPTAQLRAQATELGIAYTNDIPDDVLRNVIAQKLNASGGDAEGEVKEEETTDTASKEETPKKKTTKKAAKKTTK